MPTIKFDGDPSSLQNTMRTMDREFENFSRTGTASVLRVQYQLGEMTKVLETLKHKIATGMASGADVGMFKTLSAEVHSARTQIDKFATTHNVQTIKAVEERLNGVSAALVQTSSTTEVATGAFAGLVAKLTQARYAIGLVTFAAGTLGAALIVPVTQAVRFEYELAKLRAVADSVGAGLGRLSQQALQLSTVTQYSATDILTAQRFLVVAGYDTAEAFESVRSVINLATVEEIGLEEATRILTGTLRGFNLETSESARVSDALTVASIRTNSTVRELGVGLAYVAPVANSMNISLEETVAVMGLLSNANIRGSQGGTTMRRVLSTLAQVQSYGNRVMTSAILSTDGYMRSINRTTTEVSSFADVIRDLMALSPSEIASAFQVRAFPAIAYLRSLGPQAITDLVTELKNSRGQSALAAAEVETSTLGRLKEAGQALSSGAAAIGTVVLNSPIGAIGKFLISAATATGQLAIALADGTDGWTKWNAEADKAAEILERLDGAMSPALLSRYQQILAGLEESANTYPAPNSVLGFLSPSFMKAGLLELGSALGYVESRSDVIERLRTFVTRQKAAIEGVQGGWSEAQDPKGTGFFPGAEKSRLASEQQSFIDAYLTSAPARIQAIRASATAAANATGLSVDALVPLFETLKNGNVTLDTTQLSLDSFATSMETALRAAAQNKFATDKEAFLAGRLEDLPNQEEITQQYEQQLSLVYRLVEAEQRRVHDRSDRSAVDLENRRRDILNQIDGITEKSIEHNFSLAQLESDREATLSRIYSLRKRAVSTDAKGELDLVHDLVVSEKRRWDINKAGFADFERSTKALQSALKTAATSSYRQQGLTSEVLGIEDSTSVQDFAGRLATSRTTYRAASAERDRLYQGLSDLGTYGSATERTALAGSLESASTTADKAASDTDRAYDDLLRKVQETKRVEVALARTIAGGMSDVFTQVATGSMGMHDAFIYALNNMKAKFIQTMAEMLAENAFKSLVTAFIPGLDAANLGDSFFAKLFGGSVGGLIPGYAYGGRISSNGGNDDRIAAVKTGEYIMSTESVRRIGIQNLHALNYGSLRQGSGSLNIPVSISTSGSSRELAEKIFPELRRKIDVAIAEHLTGRR